MTLEQQKELLQKYHFTGTVVEMYHASVEAYETTENPIMTDADFDPLKAWLIETGQVEFKAGAETIEGDKKPLFYPMLSIQSVHQKDLDNNDLITELLDKKYGEISDWYNLSWKYDGMALQAEYEPAPGKDYAVLKHILTRGERTHGVDVTEAVRHAFPSKVDVYVKCVIGEALLSKKVFEEHFAANYKNERNTVAGLIRKGDPETCKHIDVMVLKLVLFDNEVMCPYDHQDMIIEHSNNCIIAEQVTYNYDQLYTALMEDFNAKRADLPYRVDGVIIRDDHNDLKETKSGLYHAYTAYKFHAEQAETEIVGIEFRLRNNGDLFPRGILKPVELDGTTVSHCSLFNYAHLLNNGLFPGAKVLIAKSGDIIPHVEHVLERSEETPEFRKEHGIDDCTYDGVNMKSTQDTSLKRFLSGILALDLKDVGDAMATKYFETGFMKVPDLFYFDPELFRKQFDNPGKQCENAITQVQKAMSGIKLEKVMRSLAFPGVGNTSSKKLTDFIIQNHFNDIQEASKLYDIDAVNLTHFSVKLAGFFPDELLNAWDKKFLESDDFIYFVKIMLDNFENINFEIEQAPEISAETVKIMFTGSPKEFGYKTKAVFLEYLKGKGMDVIEVAKIADCDVLVADNVNGSSSKLKDARKKGKEIKSYGDY